METLQLKSLIENLRPRFEHRKALILQVESVRDYDRRNSQLETVIDNMKPRLKQAELLKFNYEFKTNIPILEITKTSTKEMLNRYSADPVEILSIGDSIFDQWKQVGKELQDAINQYWTLFKSLKLFQIDEFEFNLLELFEEYKTIRKELIALKAKLDVFIQDTAPFDQSTWDHIKSLNEQIKQTWSRVSWAGVPKDVAKFINKAKVQGVAVADYNSEIQTWLQKHGLEKYFVIKVGLRYG